MTILKVEPLAQGETYKYVKAYFSSALTSLSPSEIEIRGKKDQKLYSIQTAVLSSDGTAADLTLYGNTDSDSTTFLRAGTTYVMTLTQNGQSTSLEFELPAYATDKIVTSVDMDKNTITTDWSGKTNEAGIGGTFNVAGKYDGNLGSLIGRTVSYQYDTDNNLTAFAVDDAEVVYGAMKFVNDAGIEKAYFKDALTGETYKVNATAATASKNLTAFYEAEDGDELNTLTANNTYNYTKLVLNPDGTVSTANVVKDFEQNLFVTDVDDTKVIQDKNNAFDLDGYIIVKNDEYVAPGDLELGDVVFINTEKKFADVYTNEISGELSNVISGKLDIDEETYNWDGAQYYDDGDDEYKTLSTDADKDEASQVYLNSLDTETDTTIWIARNKDIKYLDGTVVGQKKYTYTTYLVTKTAQPYVESLKDKFNVDVFDGSATTTKTIDLSQLKFYKGVEGKYSATDHDGDPATDKWGDVGTAAAYGIFTFEGKNDEDKYDDNDYDIVAMLAQGSLVKFMFDEDNNLVGFSNDEDENNAKLAGAAPAANDSSLDGEHHLQGADSPNLAKDSAKLVQALNNKREGIYTMGSYTNLWIWNENDTRLATPAGTNKDDSYKKVVLTDFDNEIQTDATKTGAAYNFKGLTYRVDGTKVTDVVVNILNDNAYAKAETTTINGVIDAITYKNNGTDTTQIVNTITIYDTAGTKTKYTADGKLTGITNGYAKGSYVTLKQDKTTEKIIAAEMTADWSMATNAPTAYLDEDHATDTFSNAKLILNNGKELTTVAGGVILKRYLKEGSWKYDIVDYTTVNVVDGAVAVWYNVTNASSDGSKIQSDMIVVEVESTAPVTQTGITFTSDKGAVIDDGDDFIASTQTTKLTARIAGLPDGVTVDAIQWYYKENATATAEKVTGATGVGTSKELTLAGVTNLPGHQKDDGTQYYLVVTGSDNNTYTSPMVTLEDPAIAFTTASGTGALTLTTQPVDQFGQTWTMDVLTATAMIDTTTGTAGDLKVGVDAAGVVTLSTTAATVAPGTYVLGYTTNNTSGQAHVGIKATLTGTTAALAAARVGSLTITSYEPVATMVADVGAGEASATPLVILDQYGVAATLTADYTFTAVKTTGTGTVGSFNGKIDKTSGAMATTTAAADLTNVANGDTFTFGFLDKTITITSAAASLATWTYGVAP